MSMKRVVMGLVVVLALGMFVVPSHAFLFGGCGSSCTPCAPYLVTVQYDPIQPQPGECTYCTCLPYGCPDGAPNISAGCPPGGGCGGGGLGLGSLFGGGGLDLGGVLCAPGSIICCATGLVGNVLDCAVSTVGGLLGGLGSGSGGGCCNAGPIGQ